MCVLITFSSIANLAASGSAYEIDEVDGLQQTLVFMKSIMTWKAYIPIQWR